jgi:parvulin-like peptidyl-prolyl isomerase
MDAGHVDTGEIFEFAAKAKLAPAAYAAAATLHSGQISDPIPASDGIHVIVMIEHRMPVQENYAAAADKLWIDFKNDAQARVKEANVRYLRSRADILLSTDARTLEAKAK